MDAPDHPSPRASATALLIKWAEMASRSRLETAIRPWRLSSGQMLVLATLDRLGALSPAALARALHLTPQAMTTLLRPLEERALIDRSPDPDSRRRVSIGLSAAGSALLARVRTVTDRVDTEITAALSTAELRQLRMLLGKIATAPRA